jgi:site-specific DNA-methyltransferase (adenine-specific)
MLRKGKARNINNMGTKNCFEVPNIIGKKQHPTEKPVALMEILISNSSFPNDVILDPFMGSGATGLACRNTGRNFIGVEIDQDYFKIAKDRIENSPLQLF